MAEEARGDTVRAFHFVSLRLSAASQIRYDAVTADFRTLPKKQARIAALSKHDCSFFFSA